MRWLIEMVSDILMGAVLALIIFITAMACSVFIWMVIKILGGFFGIS